MRRAQLTTQLEASPRRREPSHPAPSWSRSRRWPPPARQLRHTRTTSPGATAPRAEPPDPPPGAATTAHARSPGPHHMARAKPTPITASDVLIDSAPAKQISAKAVGDAQAPDEEQQGPGDRPHEVPRGSEQELRGVVPLHPTQLAATTSRRCRHRPAAQQPGGEGADEKGDVRRVGHRGGHRPPHRPAPARRVAAARHRRRAGGRGRTRRQRTGRSTWCRRAARGCEPAWRHRLVLPTGRPVVGQARSSGSASSQVAGPPDVRDGARHPAGSGPPARPPSRRRVVLGGGQRLLDQRPEAGVQAGQVVLAPTDAVDDRHRRAAAEGAARGRRTPPSRPRCARRRQRWRPLRRGSRVRGSRRAEQPSGHRQTRVVGDTQRGRSRSGSACGPR